MNYRFTALIKSTVLTVVFTSTMMMRCVACARPVSNDTTNLRIDDDDNSTVSDTIGDDDEDNNSTVSKTTIDDEKRWILDNLPKKNRYEEIRILHLKYYRMVLGLVGISSTIVAIWILLAINRYRIYCTTSIRIAVPNVSELQ